MPPINDHPLRLQLANELHARPFPSVPTPHQAVHLAMMPVDDPANRDREADHAHLVALLAHYGAPPPPPEAKHYFGEIGRARLKWESHTEFVTYTAFLPGAGARPFDPAAFDVFPADWLAGAPGKRVTSLIIRVGEKRELEDIDQAISDWFVGDSVAVSSVVDGGALLAGDFRIDNAGHMRFALLQDGSVGDRRIGRLVQRVCDIETYKAMSMLGFERVRELTGKMTPIETQLAESIGRMNDRSAQPAEILQGLLAIAAELEQLAAGTGFRFGATHAYRAIVDQRIKVLREKRNEGRQTFAEFMMRRFEPAMRTVQASERQLAALNERAVRAAELLRTQVDVERSAQNQALLASMDRRADLQLRLQNTVEKISVVAISYYAVNLAAYLLLPFADSVGLSKTLLLAALVAPIGALVWLGVRRVRHRAVRGTDEEDPANGP